MADAKGRITIDEKNQRHPGLEPGIKPEQAQDEMPYDSAIGKQCT